MSRRNLRIRLLSLVGMVGIAILTSKFDHALSAAEADQPSLHARIDAMVRASNVDVVAPIVDDGDFLRRIYLDLTGTIPPLDVARSFLADTSVDKRVRVVDELLNSRAFARHMANTFDVMLMERRPEKHIKQAEWKAYLYQAFIENRTLDQLFSELLAADGVPGPARPAARFLMDRDCDPNLLTRDVGRIVFGRDYQCAQCHDHPLIDDYVQADYYGLYAFLQRSFVFTSKDQKTIAVGEKGEGDAVFKSVFLPDVAEKMAVAHVPGRDTVEVPVLAPYAAYEVAPADDVRPVPKFSLRKRLATEATTENRVFARNVANRLWGMLMSRCIVNPPDLHHAGNAPIQPDLLDLLTDDLIAARFDIRAFLRELTLSDTYQRSLDMSTEAIVEQIPTLAAELHNDEQVLTELTAQIDAENTRYEELATAFASKREQYERAYQAFVNVAKQRNEVDQQRATLESEVSALRQSRENRHQARNAILAALESSAKVAAALVGDKDVSQSIATLAQRQLAIGAEIIELDQKIVNQQNALAEIVNRVESERVKVSEQEGKLAVARDALQTSRAEYDVVRLPHEQRQSRRQMLLRRVSDAQRLLQLSSTMDHQLTEVSTDGKSVEPQDDRDAMDADLYDKLSHRWQEGFAVAGLKALTPEQFAHSALVATGEQYRIALAAKSEWIQKRKEQSQQPAKEGATAPPADPVIDAESDTAREEIDALAYAKIESQFGPFIQLFAAAAGQPQNDFFATADQALFASNSGYLRGWASPQDGNLAHRLMQQTDNQIVVDELFLALLTRLPTAEERVDIADFLAKHVDSRANAIRDLIWSLLTSPEFRFRR